MNQVDKRLTKLEKRLEMLADFEDATRIRLDLIETHLGMEDQMPEPGNIEKRVDSLWSTCANLVKRLEEIEKKDAPVVDGVIFGDVCKCGIEKSLNMCRCKPEAKPEPSEQTLEDGKKECGCFCCTQRRSHSNPDKVSISRKVVEEVMRANYVLPNMLHDELKRAMKEGV